MPLCQKICPDKIDADIFFEPCRGVIKKITSITLRSITHSVMGQRRNLTQKLPQQSCLCPQGSFAAIILLSHPTEAGLR